MGLIEAEPGVRLHVQDVGRGRPVVLVAGFGLSHDAWDSTVRALCERHRVICIDVRGTGDSDKPAGPGAYAIERLAADIVAVLDALALERVTLVGWSFGAQMSLRVAASAPARLAQLVLLCSNAVRASRSEDFPFGPPPDRLRAALVRAEIETRIPTRRAAIASGFHAKPDESLVDWLLAISLRMPSWAAIACYETYLHSDLTADLAAVTLPVLQLMGDHDPVSLADGAPWVQERLPDGRLVVLEECGHYPMFEAREPYERALLGFTGEAG
ncbi:MAG TPA: alpha/beta hydrolase [Solirubrobacteraceae bacterium]|jgi:pimeloyl-ACP methyl ester carboxylesterase|nr:alpha/beta hydrolase [Solirubrobacteraceae bacterium]